MAVQEPYGMDVVTGATMARSTASALRIMARNYEAYSAWDVVPVVLHEPYAELADNVREAVRQFELRTAVLPFQPGLPLMEAV